MGRDTVEQKKTLVQSMRKSNRVGGIVKTIVLINLINLSERKRKMFFPTLIFGK